MDEDAIQEVAGASQGVKLEDSLAKVAEMRGVAERRFARVSTVVAATAGAVVSAAVFAAGLAPGFIVLCAVIPGVLSGLLAARAGHRSDDKYSLEQARLMIERAELRQQSRVRDRSPRVIEALRALLKEDADPSDSGSHVVRSRAAAAR